MSAAARCRLSWTRLAVIVALAVLPQLCAAIDYTARLTNPDFEYGVDVPGWTNWSFGTPFDDYRATSPAPPESAPSGLLYLHVGGSGTVVQQPNSGTFACQSVDLTGIDTIAFRYTNISDVGSFNVKPTVRIDDTVVFQGMSGVYYGDFASGSVNVSSYSGTHVVRFGTQTCTDQTFVGGGSLFDDIRLSGASLVGGPVMDPEPSQTPGNSNEVSWTYDAQSAGLCYQVVCDNDPDCSSPEMTSDWQTEMSHTFGPLAYGLTAYYRVRARLQGVAPLWLETFEDGNLDGWTQANAGATWTVTNETAAKGTSYSLRAIGGPGIVYRSISPLPPTAPERLMFWVRSARTDVRQAEVKCIDTVTITVFRMEDNGQMVVYSTTGGAMIPHWLGEYESLRWYKICMCFDWSAQNVDVYVNDVVKAENVPFYENATPFTQLRQLNVQNRDASVAWWDEFMLFNGEPVPYYSDWSNIVHSTQVEDTTPPVCAITFPEDGQRCCYLSSVTGTASDPGGEAASGVAQVAIELRRDNAGVEEHWNYMDGQWVTGSVRPIQAMGTSEWLVSYLPLEWDTTLTHQVVAVARDVAGNESAPAVVSFVPIGRPDPPILAELPETTNGDSLTLQLTDPNYPPCDEYRLQLANSEQFSPVYDTGWLTRGALTGAMASDSGASGSLRVDAGRLARAGGLPLGVTALGLLSLGLLTVMVRIRRPAWRCPLPWRGRRGFAVTELLINLAIIAILAAIIVPAFVHGRAQSRKQIGLDPVNWHMSYDGYQRDFEFRQGSVETSVDPDGRLYVKGRQGRAGWYLPAQAPGSPLPEWCRVEASVTPDATYVDGALLRVETSTTPGGSPTGFWEVMFSRYDRIYCTIDGTPWGYGSSYLQSGQAYPVGLDFLRDRVVLSVGADKYTRLTTQQLYPRSVAIGIGSGEVRNTSPPIYVDTKAWFSNVEMTYKYPPVTLASNWSNPVSTYWTTDSLLLSNLRVSRITATSAVVNWETTLPSSTEVAYGTASAASFDAYQYHGTGSGGTKYHSVMLTALAPDTTYYLRARSTDASDRVVTSNEISFKTLPAPTKQPTLVYCGDTAGTVGETVTLAARLSWSYLETPLADRPVTFIIDGASGFTVTTGADGVAEKSYSAGYLGAGTHTVRVSFAGDVEYLPAEVTATVTIAGSTGKVFSGTGKFYRDGDPKQLCQFSFAFTDAAVDSGWIKYRDLKNGVRIEGVVVDEVIVHDNRATISFHVGSPAQYYTLIVNADTDYFALHKVGGGYDADSGHSSRDKIDITVE